jgi:hypothetical protein
LHAQIRKHSFEATVFIGHCFHLSNHTGIHSSKFGPPPGFVAQMA